MALIDLHVDPYAAVQDPHDFAAADDRDRAALSVNAKLIIMDEPNSSLTQGESSVSSPSADSLSARGIAIIYVSHKIAEVLRISDRITVFRDGKCGHGRPRRCNRAEDHQHDGGT